MPGYGSRGKSSWEEINKTVSGIRLGQAGKPGNTRSGRFFLFFFRYTHSWYYLSKSIISHKTAKARRGDKKKIRLSLPDAQTYSAYPVSSIQSTEQNQTIFSPSTNKPTNPYTHTHKGTRGQEGKYYTKHITISFLPPAELSGLPPLCERPDPIGLAVCVDVE